MKRIISKSSNAPATKPLSILVVGVHCFSSEHLHLTTPCLQHAQSIMIHELLMPLFGYSMFLALRRSKDKLPASLNKNILHYVYDSSTSTSFFHSSLNLVVILVATTLILEEKYNLNNSEILNEVLLR